MYKALVITTSLPEAEEIHGRLLSGRFPDMAFRYPSQLSREAIDMRTLVQRCSEVIKEEEIDVIVSLHPEFAIVHAILLEEFPELRGPSVESVFMCINRLYLKEKVLHGFNVQHSVHELNELSKEMVEAHIQELRPPVIVKDPYAFHDGIDKKIKSLRHIHKDIKTINEVLTQSLDKAQSILEGKINMEKFPSAFDALYLVEEHISHNTYSTTIHYVEACVKDGNIIPWALSDINYYRHRPHYTVQCISVPSSVDDNDSIHIWAVFREAAQRLIDAGFNNQFIHAKIALSNRGHVKIIELSPCILSWNTHIYAEVFQDGDNLRAQMELSLGHEQWSPKPRAGRFAMRAIVSTHHRGIMVADLVNAEAVKNAGNSVRMLCGDGEINDDRLNADGSPLLMISIFESSKSDCLFKIKKTCAEVLTMVSKEVAKSYLPHLSPPAPVEKVDPIIAESKSRNLTPLTNRETSARTERNIDDTINQGEEALVIGSATRRPPLGKISPEASRSQRPSLGSLNVDSNTSQNVSLSYDSEYSHTITSARPGSMRKRTYSYGARDATEVGDPSSTKPGILPQLDAPVKAIERIEKKKELIREGAFLKDTPSNSDEPTSPGWLNKAQVMPTTSSAALPNIARVKSEIRSLRSNSFSVPQGAQIKGKGKGKSSNPILSDLEKLRNQGVLDRRVSTPGLRSKKHLMGADQEA